ncbi:MAG TPA: DUF5130 family protein [Mycobacteriales bacterium]|nr:DUF5130 family protein [Mycobacteriales bacterium]
MVPGKPLSERQRRRVARAVRAAEDWTGLQLCVYLGPTEDDPLAHAHALMAELGLHEEPAVLLLVAPQARRLEIVTSPAAAERISDYEARLAALSMSASFGVGDVAGGIVEGVRLLAQAAGPGTRTGADLPDVLDAAAR